MEDDAHIVLDQHDCELAVLVQAADELRDLVCLLVAHAGRRFVKQQQARLERERHHDLGCALIAMGEFSHQAIRLAGEASHVEQVGDPGADRLVGNAREPGRKRNPDATSTGMRRFSRTESSGKTSVT